MSRQIAPVGTAILSVLFLSVACISTASGSDDADALPLPRTGLEELAPVDVALLDGDIYATFPGEGRVAVSEPNGGRAAEAGQSTAEWRRVADPLHRPWGVARVGDEAICVSHYTSDDPLRRLSAVSCLRGGSWQPLVEGIGQGINGIAPAGEGIWLAAWRDTAVESRDGFLAHFAAGEVQEVIELPSQVPQFVSVMPDGGLLVTTWLEDASGYTAGRLLNVAPDRSVHELNVEMTLPAGVFVAGDVTWVADHGGGSLVAIDSHGREIVRREGLAGPLGVDMGPEDEICAADARAGRVTCQDGFSRLATE